MPENDVINSFIPFSTFLGSRLKCHEIMIDENKASQTPIPKIVPPAFFISRLNHRPVFQVAKVRNDRVKKPVNANQPGLEDFLLLIKFPKPNNKIACNSTS